MKRGVEIRVNKNINGRAVLARALQQGGIFATFKEASGFILGNQTLKTTDEEVIEAVGCIVGNDCLETIREVEFTNPWQEPDDVIERREKAKEWYASLDSEKQSYVDQLKYDWSPRGVMG